VHGRSRPELEPPRSPAPAGGSGAIRTRERAREGLVGGVTRLERHREPIVARCEQPVGGPFQQDWRRRAAGGSPATADTILSKWNRDRCARAASSSPGSACSSREAARRSTNRAKVSAAELMLRTLTPAASSRLIEIAHVPAPASGLSCDQPRRGSDRLRSRTLTRSALRRKDAGASRALSRPGASRASPPAGSAGGRGRRRSWGRRRRRSPRRRSRRTCTRRCRSAPSRSRAEGHGRSTRNSVAGRAPLSRPLLPSCPAAAVPARRRCR
jgi:hypothetical protein